MLQFAAIKQFLPITILLCLFFLKDYLGDKVLAVGTLIGTFIEFIYFLKVNGINY
mgnify:CR=1 FL=1